jgi:hypothetical protein
LPTIQGKQEYYFHHAKCHFLVLINYSTISAEAALRLWYSASVALPIFTSMMDAKVEALLFELNVRTDQVADKLC